MELNRDLAVIVAEALDGRDVQLQLPAIKVFELIAAVQLVRWAIREAILIERGRLFVEAMSERLNPCSTGTTPPRPDRHHR